MITLEDKSDVSVKQRMIGTADSAGIVGHGRGIHGVGLGTAPTCHFYKHDVRCVFLWAAYRSEYRYSSFSYRGISSMKLVEM
jgi:hypothetical protein